MGTSALATIKESTLVDGAYMIIKVDHKTGNNGTAELQLLITR